MATAKASSSGTRGAWRRVALALIVVGGALGWTYREPIEGYTAAGAAVGARTACSCRYIAGRSLEDCEKDFEPGMALVFLSDDPENQAVTARVPIIASDTARFHAGYGCLLDPWDRG